MNSTAPSYTSEGIVPHLIPEEPQEHLRMYWHPWFIDHRLDPAPGTFLWPEAMSWVEIYQWKWGPNSKYFAWLMVDMDDTPGGPMNGLVTLHTFRVNVDAARVSYEDSNGNQVFHYKPPTRPVCRPGDHRYVWLIYRQKDYIQPDQLPPAIPVDSDEGRYFFNLAQLIQQYNLEGVWLQ